MNIVDYVILGMIGLSVLWGFYRGFIQSVLSMGACLLSFVGSFFLYPQLANLFQSNESVIVNLIHYTDASSRIGDLELALSNVSQLTQDSLAKVLSHVNLPQPISDILSFNLQNNVFSSQNINTVADYANQTIVTVSLNILSFLICFVVSFVVLSILINMLRAVFRFPLLKQLDWLFGGVFGALRGVVLCYAVFVSVPLVLTVIPFEQVNTLISESTLAQIFNNGNLVLSIMNQRL